MPTTLRAIPPPRLHRRLHSPNRITSWPR
jgi:hypothetical protein